MLKAISGIFKDKDILSKILYSVLAIIVFRVLTAVPAPGLDKDALAALFGSVQAGEVISLVSGNVLDQASIIAIGLGSYINASVIVQLLTSVIPSLESLSEEGTSGQRKLSQYTRALTVPLAIIQSFVIYTALRQGIAGVETVQLSPIALVTMIASLTAGAMIIMWLGEVITESGITNGVSLIIFAGIVAAFPGVIAQSAKVLSPLEQIIVLVSFLLVVILVVFVNEAQRKITVQYASRVRGSKRAGAQASHLPLKLNQAGVIPVIFAISLISFPQLISQLFLGSQFPDWVRNTASVLSTLTTTYPFFYNTLLFVLIVAFSFFYMFVVFNPEKVSENLKKQGGFISGIRPGKSTEEYLRKIMWRLGLIGGVFLATIAILPSVASAYLDSSYLVAISGTGLLIVVSVALDIRRQIESLLVTRSYSDYR